jgi:hypothetical protein
VAKPAALRAWSRLSPSEELVGRIVAKIVAARKSEDWLKSDGRFIPYPATFLNQRRWEDEELVEVQTMQPNVFSVEKQLEEEARRVILMS